MRKKFITSLSSKIVLSIALVSFLVLVILFFVLEKMNKDAFYSVELDKANIIVNTIEPLVAVNLYLAMKENIKRIVHNTIQNPNIVSIQIFKDKIMMYEEKSQNDDLENVFMVEKTILLPNTQKKIGKIVLLYSSKNYKELRSKQRNLTVWLMILLMFLFAILSFYIKKLMSPLRKIAKSLKNYTPNTIITIPYKNQQNEIGLISNALNEMQDNIVKYSQKQEDINHHLEALVNEKTLKLQTQLYTNSLTGLPNRLSLMNDIIGLEDGALIIINVDDFKEINDFFGHIIGDNLLIDLAKKLNTLLGNQKNIELKHLHGDEFAFVYKNRPSYDDFKDILEKLVADIEAMVFYHDNNELGVRVTIGAVYGIESALEKADIALKLAKKRHKSYMIYDETLNIEEQYEENMLWIKKLKIAIKNDKIIPYYQPIFDNQSGKIVSCECLMRMIDEEENVIAPFKFLDVAKKSRVYSKLTKLMFKKSCEYFEDIDCDFSVNMSISDMLDSEIIEYIKHKIKKHNVAQKIVLEILETEGIKNYEEIISFINEMKALGCKIAIDDFGSGYSNFEYLLKLNIDYIKIDGTLIKNLDTDKNAQIVAQTVVDFANKLHVTTIAEFVHNEAVFNKVKELNIDRTQGFYLAKPQEDIKDLIKENNKA